MPLPQGSDTNRLWKPILYFSLFATFLFLFLPAKMYKILSLMSLGSFRRTKVLPTQVASVFSPSWQPLPKVDLFPMCSEKGMQITWVWGGKNRVRTNANQYLNKSICELLRRVTCWAHKELVNWKLFISRHSEVWWNRERNISKIKSLYPIDCINIFPSVWCLVLIKFYYINRKLINVPWG